MKPLWAFLLAVLTARGTADQLLAEQTDQRVVSHRLTRHTSPRVEPPRRIRARGVPAKDVTLVRKDKSRLRLPGEFEKQEFLFLSTGELTPDHVETIADITAAVHRNIRVVVLLTRNDQRNTLVEALSRRVGMTDGVSFYRVAHDTRWIRDFGPTVLCNGPRPVIIDWQYDPSRPNDDDVPLNLATMSSTACELAPLQLEGGNLLSNGHGVCVTTTAMTERNGHKGLNETAACDLLKSSVGARQVVVLEPLAGEDTGHVDMFMTFTGPTSVVVGAYSPKEDPENAALLDRNAARLASVKTPSGRLRVERIPMGRRDNGLWRTYTNCIYANGVLLVPAYQDGDDKRLRQALALYQRLLPQWRIVPIDATQLIEEGGALHCASLNVPCLSDRLNAKRLPIDNSTITLIEAHHYSPPGKTSALAPMRQRDETSCEQKLRSWARDRVFAR